MIQRVMQVGYLNPFDNYGGVEKYILMHAKALYNLYNVSVDVLCSGDFQSVTQSPFGKVITLRVPLFNRKNLFFISKYLYARKVKKYLANHYRDYDAIHFHGDNGSITSKYNDKAILTLHGMARNITSMKKRIITYTTHKIELNNVKKARFIFSVTLEAKEEFSRYTNKINLIKASVDTDLYKVPTEEEKKGARLSLGFDPTKIVGIIIGRDPVRKGLNVAIDAITQMHDNRIQLVAIGFPIVENKDNNISYTGNVDESTKVLYLKASNFFIFPSLKEGFPISVLEAACMGLPLIVSRQSGVSDLKSMVPFYREIDSGLAEDYSNALKEFITEYTQPRYFYNLTNLDKIAEYSIKSSVSIYMNAYSKLETTDSGT